VVFYELQVDPEHVLESGVLVTVVSINNGVEVTKTISNTGLESS
jgi:hypothetical protein